MVYFSSPSSLIMSLVFVFMLLLIPSINNVVEAWHPTEHIVSYGGGYSGAGEHQRRYLVDRSGQNYVGRPPIQGFYSGDPTFGEPDMRVMNMQGGDSCNGGYIQDHPMSAIRSPLSTRVTTKTQEMITTQVIMVDTGVMITTSRVKTVTINAALHDH
ncbi:hypothetical protein IHE45_03G085200 [Dioscorea alata]|uniref:Uncharacterized protein n=1 Tax=Dioscorea alata TaxID=55571 RepID=A0ACB7WLP7_DIOAL|nr:hypothetical protein IHE45_03G085200 [Dioscorea alata]